MIRVNKVKVAVIRDISEKRILSAINDLIPSHLRNFQLMFEADYHPFYDPQSLMSATFPSFRKQKLQPEANSQKRHSRINLLQDGFHHP